MTDFDEIYDVIGHFRRYQWLLYLMIVYAAIPSGFNAVASVFLQYTPSYHCKVPEDSIEYLPVSINGRCGNNVTASCSQYEDPYDINSTQVSCQDGYTYDDTDVFSQSIISEFNLVCDDKLNATISSVLFFFGFFLGAILGGFISDNYGRRTAIAVGAVGNIAVSLACSFSPNWWVFAIFRVLIGLFGNVAYVASFVFIMEVIGPKYRSACGIWVQGFFAIGYACLSLVAYIWPYWRHFQRALSVVPAPLLLFMLIVKESPRYLISRGKVDEAVEVIQQIGRLNGVKTDKLYLTEQIVKSAAKTQQAREADADSDQTYSFIDLFKQGRTMTLITLNLMFNWIVNSITYYGLSLNSAALPTNLYISNLLYAAMELPAYAFVSWAMETKFLGRRLTLTWCLLVGGGCTLLSTVFAEIAFCDKDADDAFSNPFIVVGFVLALIGKFAISGSFAVVYNITAELYPTQVRANAVGICSMASRIGGMLSPVFGSLYEVVSWLPGALFGGFAIVAGLMSFFLPETHGIPMLMSFEEAHMLYEGRLRKYLADKEEENKVTVCNKTFHSEDF